MTKKAALPALKTLDAKSIRVLSELVGRATLAAQMGLQYGGSRDIYQALGYKTDLTYADYAAFYSRLDIASAIIDRPVDATWRGGFELLESDDDNETDLEKEFYRLYDVLSLHSKFARLDRLTGIGKYGILLLGLSDVKDIQGFANQVSTGRGLKLLWVKAFGEGSAASNTIEYERNPASERYGQPNIYQVTIANTSTGGKEVIRVHYSRVIHVADGLLESEIEGTPRLQTVYNRLMDLEKLVGASAEMFWRGARPGYQGKVEKDTFLSQATKDDLKSQIDEYEHNLRRMILNEGITWDTLASQVADPEKHVLVQLQMVSAAKNIPLRILTGSEIGQLAGEQDRNNWYDHVNGRRAEFAEPWIIRPFVDRCIKYRVLPAPEDDYTVKWKPLWEQSDKDKAEVGKTRATAIKEYATNPGAESIVPPESFMRICLGLDDEQIALIEEEKKAAMLEEPEVEPELEPEPTPEPGGDEEYGQRV